MKHLIKTFKEIGISDIASVGGKNASLGEMYNKLSSSGITIPNGFATTSDAFWLFLQENKIKNRLQNILKGLDTERFSNLSEIGLKARKLITDSNFSEAFSEAIYAAYLTLGNSEEIEVAVRSSATAEDLPTASFAGQHDTFLNIKGKNNLIAAVKNCMASLYTDRAIKYREDNGFEHFKIAISVGIQKMVRSDKGCAGIGFTIDPESGFKDVIHITGVWGLGENIVQGAINPDEYYVFKPTLKLGYNAIIQKRLGGKESTLIYAESSGHSSTINIETSETRKEQFILTDEEVLKLAKWALIIEEHYNKPMDLEWAKDGITNELYITQARPETVHTRKEENNHIEYKLKEEGKMICEGSAIGNKIAIGTARFLKSPLEATKLKPGDILITDTISPDWDPLLKGTAGIVTNKGGRTSHAAIVARELGVPAVVGTNCATSKIKDGQKITIVCSKGSRGIIYQDHLKFERVLIDFSKYEMPKTEVKIILSDPESAFDLSNYPNNGVGLLRMEFIITHIIKIHPMALVNFDNIKNEEDRRKIDFITRHYSSKQDYFIEELAQGIARICAAFYPKEVILRTSDFKTNEYAKLIGGEAFEPVEENPMLGFRGASRYYNSLYSEGFKLECKAIKRVREIMGLTNLKVMIPFCRTLKEAAMVKKILNEQQLIQGEHGLEFYMMVEIPSNVLLLEKFAEYFDGFSIGSNDLTQLTLGLDRDSELVANLFNENDEAAKKMISLAIEKARISQRKIGICGQAPSDYPEYANFLIQAGINSISFNPDALLQGILNMNASEKQPNYN